MKYNTYFVKGSLILLYLFIIYQKFQNQNCGAETKIQIILIIQHYYAEVEKVLRKWMKIDLKAI